MLIFLTLADAPEDRSKFEILYTEYRQLMFRIALGILKNPQDAEDVVHDAFLKVAHIIENISEPLSMKTKALMIIVTRNTAINCYNRNKRRKVSAMSDEIKMEDPSADFAENAEKREALALSINALPDNYREVILLRYYLGYSVDEISKILSITAENVRKRIQRAKKALEENLYGEEAAEL